MENKTFWQFINQPGNADATWLITGMSAIFIALGFVHSAELTNSHWSVPYIWVVFFTIIPLFWWINRYRKWKSLYR